MFAAVADRQGSSAASAAPGPPDPAGRASGISGESNEAEPIPVRPLTWRELADLPFAVLQYRIRLVAGLAGAGFVLALALVLAITALVSWVSDGSSTASAWAAVIATVSCAWMLRLWVVGVTVPIGLAVVHRQPVTAGSAWRRLRPVTARLALNHLVGTLTGIGILALGALLVVTLIPATIWLGRVRAGRWPVAPILFTESPPYSAAVARAKLLATGRLMPVAGLWIFLRGVLLVLVAPIAGLLGYLSDISGTHRWAVVAMLAGAALLIAAFAAAVDAATAVVVYLDRRCDREGLDIRIPAGRVVR